MIDNRNRVLHHAVAVSLAMHALLLLAFPQFLDTARHAASIPPQIVARLTEPQPVIPPPTKAEAVKPPPRVTNPAPKAPVSIAREFALELPPSPAEPVAAPAPVTSPPTATMELQPAPVVEAPESLSRDQYRLQLIDAARRHKRYPPLARENNWQGDVRVAVVIAMNGWPSVTLRGSSGYEVLDRQAVEMFTLAVRAVPVPPALRGKEFALDLRAIYGLED